MTDSLLSATDVRAIAELARLQLNEADIPRLQRQLSDILGYFQKLEELDTSHIDATASILPLTNVMRPDNPGPPLPLNDALANAQHSAEQQFRVPQVLDSQ